MISGMSQSEELRLRAESPTSTVTMDLARYGVRFERTARGQRTLTTSVYYRTEPTWN